MPPEGREYYPSIEYKVKQFLNVLPSKIKNEGNCILHLNGSVGFQYNRILDLLDN
jgi:hypothetical protein